MAVYNWGSVGGEGYTDTIFGKSSVVMKCNIVQREKGK